MTIANTKVLAKVVAAFAVASLALASFALSANAQTTTTTTTTTTASACASFNRDLTVGSSGADVTALQNWLISKGFAIAAGATGYFGGQTQAALAQYQASVKISPAAGYFGPITRAQVNAAACSNAGGNNNGGNTGGDNDDDDDSDNDDDNDDMGDLEGGAGDLESADFTSGLNNEDVGEGDEDVEVAGLDLEADGSDIALTASRVTIMASDDNEADDETSEDLEDYVESLTLWFDGEELDTVDVEDIDEDDGEYTHTFSFDWEDAIIREGEEGQLTLSVTAEDNIDDDDIEGENSFEVYFETVRYVDAQGATVTEDSLDDIGDEDDANQEGREFSFETFADANDVELTIDESDDSPEEGTAEVDENGGDAEVVLLVGELEAEGADIELTEFRATITATGSEIDMDNDGTVEAGELTGETTENVASEYCLQIDGDEVDCVDSDEFEGNTASTTAEYSFDVDDVVIGEGETAEFTITAVLDDIEDDEIAVLEASVDEDQVEAETEEDGEELDEVNGSANGEPQTFRESGLAVEFDEEASDATNTRDNVGEFEFVFDVEAFGDDIELSEEDFNITVRNDDGATVATGISRQLESNDFDEEEDGTEDFLEIDENQEGTITFTVFVTIADGAEGVYEVTVNSITATTDDGDTTTTRVDEELETFIGSDD